MPPDDPDPVRPQPAWPSGWKTVWLLSLFDLPTETKAQRRAYARFRKDLLNDGFTMMQYSVYQRHCASPENAELHLQRIAAVLPPEGEVRFLVITDKQFGRIRTFWGSRRKPAEKTPAQLEFF
ncbi:CRISPR-associated endonuclease Cas2 [uncultured Tistrella sp.]|uniref:CRISPR-associated endonuclease Cas2 n=1 Tax=Tistrella mobilis TaxID=171437 RepID=UPI002617BBDD|nr:CRISPR-associated endonuclease Cas2 [uncultured Tistrella sp.]